MDEVKLTQQIGELMRRTEDVNLVRDCEIALGIAETRSEVMDQLRLRLAVRLGLANTVQASKVRKGQLISIGGVTVRVAKREKWRISGAVRVYWEDVGEGFPTAQFGFGLRPLQENSAKPWMFDIFQPDAELQLVTRKLFNGKPLEHWKKLAVESVMDTLVRGMVPKGPHQSIIHALATKMLRDLAISFDPRAFRQLVAERERFRGDGLALLDSETDQDIWDRFLRDQ